VEEGNPYPSLHRVALLLTLTDSAIESALAALAKLEKVPAI
jgi:hypothetical protein